MVIDALFGVNPADRRQEMYSPCITLPPQNSYTYSRQRSTASLYCLSCILYLLHSLCFSLRYLSVSLSLSLNLFCFLSLSLSSSLWVSLTWARFLALPQLQLQATVHTEQLLSPSLFPPHFPSPFCLSPLQATYMPYVLCALYTHKKGAICPHKRTIWLTFFGSK